jgi:UDP-N-acetylmuramyl pentapeptide synthase
MQCLKMKTGTRILDDTYNANPQSVRNALETLARIKTGGRSIAVLGDMGELGAESEAAHKDIGQFTAQTGTDLLFAMGEHAEDLGQAAIAAGMAEGSVCVGGQHNDVATKVSARARAEDWILVKGSRSMKMEQIVQSLISEGRI